MKILLVEDDPNLGFLTQEHLEEKKYKVKRELNGKSALDLFQKESFDLCIVDIMMPIMDGFHLVSEIKKLNQDIPVIFLTAKSLKEDKIKGFKLGADDYITKPFSVEELYYRVEAIKKRTYGKKKESLKRFQLGKYDLDFEKRTMSINSELKTLSSKEASMLKIFCENVNQSVNREEILISVWGQNTYYNSRSMDVYISKLRKYFSSDERIKILNEHGVGFKLIYNADITE
jgi:DNA-binding response OmpR family regulator